MNNSNTTPPALSPFEGSTTRLGRGQTLGTLHRLPGLAGYTGHFDHCEVDRNRIEIITSDGDASRTPHVLPPPDFEAGYGGSWIQLGPDNDLYQHWVKTIGKYLAPLAFGEVEEPYTPSFELLESPVGYTLWIHARRNPRPGKNKRDAYLYGKHTASTAMLPDHSDSVEGSKHHLCFRSSMEPVLHFDWLIRGKRVDAKGQPCCECSHCIPDVRCKSPGATVGAGKKPGRQTAISKALKEREQALRANVYTME